MKGKSRGRVRVGFVMRAVVIGAVVASVACVGSESDSARQPEQHEPIRVSGGTDLDSIKPVPYQVFERDYATTDSSKLLVRLMVLGEVRSEVLTRTVMAALDSIGASDTSVVASRAILYLAKPTEPGRARLVPAVWAEWVPPEGFDAAKSRERRTVHRTYVYHVNPGWFQEPATGTSDE